MAIFELGTKSLFLTTLGIPYGYIYTEECAPFLVINLAQVQEALGGAVEKKMMTADEAQQVQDACTTAGILKDMDQVFERILAYQIPADFVPAHEFRLCTRCPADAQLPAHGYIHKTTGGEDHYDDFRFDRKTEGITRGMDLVRNDRLHVLDAIYICQQILSSPLAKNKEDMEKTMGGMDPRRLLAFILQGMGRRARELFEEEDED